MPERFVVIADTSPVNYLLLIDQIQLLPLLYDLVIVPPAVAAELMDSRSPSVVRDWMSHRPGWLQIRALEQPPRVATRELDLGESEAIELALQLRADLLLIDETAGREVAQQLHLKVRGTLGILIQAADRGLVQLPTHSISWKRPVFTSLLLFGALRWQLTIQKAPHDPHLPIRPH